MARNVKRRYHLRGRVDTSGGFSYGGAEGKGEGGGGGELDGSNRFYLHAKCSCPIFQR